MECFTADFFLFPNNSKFFHINPKNKGTSPNVNNVKRIETRVAWEHAKHNLS